MVFPYPQSHNQSYYQFTSPYNPYYPNEFQNKQYFHPKVYPDQKEAQFYSSAFHHHSFQVPPIQNTANQGQLSSKISDQPQIAGSMLQQNLLQLQKIAESQQILKENKDTSSFIYSKPTQKQNQQQVSQNEQSNWMTEQQYIQLASQYNQNKNQVQTGDSNTYNQVLQTKLSEQLQFIDTIQQQQKNQTTQNQSKINSQETYHNLLTPARKDIEFLNNNSQDQLDQELMSDYNYSGQAHSDLVIQNSFGQSPSPNQNSDQKKDERLNNLQEVQSEENVRNCFSKQSLFIELANQNSQNIFNENSVGGVSSAQKSFTNDQENHFLSNDGSIISFNQMHQSTTPHQTTTFNHQNDIQSFSNNQNENLSSANNLPQQSQNLNISTLATSKLNYSQYSIHSQKQKQMYEKFTEYESDNNDSTLNEKSKANNQLIEKLDNTSRWFDQIRKTKSVNKLTYQSSVKRKSSIFSPIKGSQNLNKRRRKYKRQKVIDDNEMYDETFKMAAALNHELNPYNFKLSAQHRQDALKLKNYLKENQLQITNEFFTNSVSLVQSQFNNGPNQQASNLQMNQQQQQQVQSKGMQNYFNVINIDSSDQTDQQDDYQIHDVTLTSNSPQNKVNQETNQGKISSIKILNQQYNASSNANAYNSSTSQIKLLNNQQSFDQQNATLSTNNFEITQQSLLQQQNQQQQQQQSSQDISTDNINQAFLKRQQFYQDIAYLTKFHKNLRKVRHH
eukprot:403337369